MARFTPRAMMAVTAQQLLAPAPPPGPIEPGFTVTMVLDPTLWGISVQATLAATGIDPSEVYFESEEGPDGPPGGLAVRNG